jgi:hypothetical protein
MQEPEEELMGEARNNTVRKCKRKMQFAYY